MRKSLVQTLAIFFLFVVGLTGCAIPMFDQVPQGKEQYESEYKELALGIREHLRRVDEMVDKYADK